MSTESKIKFIFIRLVLISAFSTCCNDPDTMFSLEPKGHPRARIPESPSEETLIPDQTLQNSNQRSRLDFNIISRKIQSSLPGAETTANISITCVNCASQGQGRGHWERHWQGIIIGRRAPGCIAALLVRIKLKHTNAPFIGLLTLCPKCCTELKQDDQMDRIFKFQGDCPGKIIFRVSHMEMEELFLSKVILLIGMSPTPFQTIGSDGKWKEWNQLRRD